jgi:hypothetical protein
VRASVTMPPATAPIIVRLPNGIEIEATNMSPAWIAAMVNELTRST